MLTKIVAVLASVNAVVYVWMLLQAVHDWGFAFVLWIPPILSVFIVPLAALLIFRAVKNSKAYALPLGVTIIALVPTTYFYPGAVPFFLDLLR